MEEKSISIDEVNLKFLLVKGEIKGYRKNIETVINSKGGGSTVVPLLNGQWVSKTKELKISSTTKTIIEFTIVNEDGTEIPKTLIDEEVNFRDGQSTVTIFEKEKRKEIGVLIEPLDHFILTNKLKDVVNRKHPAYSAWTSIRPKLVEKDKKVGRAKLIMWGGVVLFVFAPIGQWAYVFLITSGAALVYQFIGGKGAKSLFEKTMLESFKRCEWLSTTSVSKITGLPLYFIKRE